MTRPTMLRAGYVALGLAFLALAGSAISGALIIAGLALGFVAAVLLLFSGDDLPKWSGIVILVYFLVLVVSFLLATSITVRKGGAYHIDFAGAALFDRVKDYLGLAFPLMLAATAMAATWERERPVRWLLLGAGGGFVLVGILTVALTPTGASPTDAALKGQAQANVLLALGALSALSGAAGAAWSAARPEEYG